MIKKLKKEQILIGALVGILLLVIAIPVPGSEKIKEDTVIQMEEYAKEDLLEVQLKEILQKIDGVGNVDVFVTYEDEGRLVVEKDETASEEQIQEADSNGGTRTTTTVRNEKETIYGSNETPYVIQKMLPTVKGILVVAEGCGNSMVKKQIQETMEALFGLDSHKISIMKMEVAK